MSFLNFPFYGLSIALQVFCVWHCVRRGANQQWIWLIVFLPFAGCLVYLFSEVFSKSGIRRPRPHLAQLLQPGGTIGRLERQVEFSDTFANRMALADACARGGQVPRALALYESCLSGPFQDAEQVYLKLIPLYFDQGRCEEILPLGRALRALPEFQRSRAHLLFAQALEACDQAGEAEAEFQKLQGRFSAFEARYAYACFLLRQQRSAEADELLRVLVAEERQLGSHERREAREWIRKAKEQLAAAVS